MTGLVTGDSDFIRRLLIDLRLRAIPVLAGARPFPYCRRVLRSRSYYGAGAAIDHLTTMTLRILPHAEFAHSLCSSIHACLPSRLSSRQAHATPSVYPVLTSYHNATFLPASPPTTYLF